MKRLDVPAAREQLRPGIPPGVSHGIRGSGDSACGLKLRRSMPPLGSVGRSSVPESTQIEHSVLSAKERSGGGFHNAKVLVGVPFERLICFQSY